MEEIDELSAYLKEFDRKAADRYACYRVEQVIKESDIEVTEKVYFCGMNGIEIGPFIRKRIANIEAASSTTNIYQELFQAQKRGKRFRFLPPIFDCFSHGDNFVVVMDYVNGRTLKELIEQNASIELVKQIFSVLCEAVIELHESFSFPIIHRDLKPSNIIFNENEKEITIIDLGISRKYRKDANTDTKYFGTPDYSPPEQFGFSQTTVRSDIYSLSMILYSCLTDATPSPQAIRSLINNAGQSSNPAIPTPLAQVITRAGAFDPAHRYDSVRSLKEAFHLAITELETMPTSTLNAHFSPNAHFPTNSQFIAQPASLSKPLSITEYFGLMWNALVGLVWILFLFAAIDSVIDPTGEWENAPLLPNILFTLGVFIIFSLVFYVILDKRVLRRKIPFMRNRTWRNDLPLLAIVFSISIILAFVAVFFISDTV